MIQLKQGDSNRAGAELREARRAWRRPPGLSRASWVRGVQGIALILLAASEVACPQSASIGTHSEMLASTEWLETHLRDPRLTILHVAQEEASYRAEHIPGAYLVRWREVATERDGIPDEVPTLDSLAKLARRLGVDTSGALEDYDPLAKAFMGVVGGHAEPSRRIVIYDDGVGLAAAQVYAALDYIGAADRVALLDGQLRTWKAEGRPISSDPPQPKHSDYVPSPHPELFVSMDFVQELVSQRKDLAESRVALLDIRSEAQFSGREAGPAIIRPGHIPTAVNVPWIENLASAERPLFRSPADLDRRYREAGLRPDDLVVTYGRTGAEAALAYFTLKLLGFDVRIYEGGFAEWSGAADTDVLTE